MFNHVLGKSVEVGNSNKDFITRSHESIVVELSDLSFMMILVFFHLFLANPDTAMLSSC
jgi:hypothetical protein